MKGIKYLVGGCILALVSIATLPSDGLAQSIRFDQDNYRIEINANYRGTALKVTGKNARYQDIILKLEGKPQEIELNRKGKWLFLWMNVGKVKVENAPAIYYVISTKELNEISPDSVMIPLNVGYSALEKKIQFNSEEPLNGDEFSEFILLQEHQDRYRVLSGSIEFESVSQNLDNFSVVFDLPAMIPPGTYTLTGLSFKEGNLESQATSKLVVEKKGLPLIITNLAYNSAALYGIVAILAAILTGLLMGVIFGKKAKVH